MKTGIIRQGIVLVISIFAVISVQAGTTGKINGRVIEKGTGEPIIGLNVTVEGSSIGASTDMNGNYTILNIPPGLYRVKGSIVGYANVTFNDVRVFIDQTTTLNFEMNVSAVEIGEVVVAAPHEAVKKDISTSVTSFSNDEVQTLPIQSVTEVAGLQAGVESGLVIRGGGADQSLFLLDGVTMRDPRNNQPLTSVPLSAISEISIERGGFNAEYGQLRSGIMNVVTKEGTKERYDLAVTVRYSPPARKYSGISPYDPGSVWLRPYLDPAVAWTGTSNGAWDYHTQRQYPSFKGWNAISQQLMTDTDPSNDLSPAGAQRLFRWQHRKEEIVDASDYNIDAGFGGPIPYLSDMLGNARFFLAYRNEREMLLVPLSRPDYYEENTTLRFTSDIYGDMKIGISATQGRSENVAVNGTEQSSSTDYIRTPEQVAARINRSTQNPSIIFLDSYNSLTDIRNRSFSIQFTHVLGPDKFYEARIEHIARKYNTAPPAMRDTNRMYQIFSGYFVDEGPFGWSSLATTGIADPMFFFGGHTATARDHSAISSTTFKGNYTVQIEQHHQLKAGMEFVYNDLALEYGVVNLAFPESNNYVNERRFPLRGSAYVQDKLEYEGFIANLGLRVDYSNANVDWPEVDAFDKSFFSSSYDPAQKVPTQSATSRWSFSPRLGISHPITESAKLYFNYGHFKQLPTYEQLLRYSRNVTGSVRNIGDPDLVLANTIAYELGLDQSFLEEYLIQLAGFYRDITDQQDFSLYIANSRGNFQYTKPNNNSYQDVRGFEVTLRKMGTSWWNGFANYTYQVSKSGRFNKDRIYQNPTDQRKYDLNTTTLYQFRPIPTPFARINLSLFTPVDFGPALGEFSPMGDWMLTLLGDWRSGGYTTWQTNNDPSIADNVELVNYYNLNLRISKSVKVGPVKLILFADVQNVLNTNRLNLASFYDVNDQLDYYNSLHLPTSTAYTNISGEDKVGDYRADGVAFQPIEQIGSVSSTTPAPTADRMNVIFYDKSTGKYMKYNNSTWSEVESGTMEKILDDKAYIDMPNMSSFWFLNPRQLFFGLTVNLEF